MSSIEWREKYRKAKEELFRQFNDAVLDFDREHGIVRSDQSRNSANGQILNLVYELLYEYPEEKVPEIPEVPDLGDEEFPNLCLHSVE